MTVEQTKKCTWCGVDKEITTCFHKTYKKEGSYAGRCKDCCLKRQRELSKLNPEASKRRSKKSVDKFRKLNPEKWKELTKRHREKNKLSIAIKNKKWREENKEILREKKRIYTLNNKSLLSEKNKKYNSKPENKIKKNIKAREFYKEKIRDPHFKLIKTLRSRISLILKKNGYTKKTKTYGMLGEEYSVVKSYIERQFKKGMTWSNHGEWHIDHIIPLESAKTEEELLNLFHYRNLQPLWAKENILKSNKILPVQVKMAI